MVLHPHRHVDHFPHVAAVAENIRGHDRDLLARLRPDQLSAQYHARWLLYQHLRHAWDIARASGLNPVSDPVLGSLAVLCDLTGDLLHTADAVALRSRSPLPVPSSQDPLGVRSQASGWARPPA